MLNRTKESPEEKVAMVKKCLSGELSLTDVAGKAGVNEFIRS